MHYFALNVPARLYVLSWFESICHLSENCPSHGTINFRQSDFRQIQVERALLLPFPVRNLAVSPFPFPLVRNLAVLPFQRTPIEGALLSLWTVFEGASLRPVRLFHLVSSKVNFFDIKFELIKTPKRNMEILFRMYVKNHNRLVITFFHNPL